MYRKPSVARALGKTYEDLLAANLRERAPVWLQAMRKVPPADSLVRDPTVFSTKGKLDFEKGPEESGPADDTLGGMQIKRRLPKGCVSHSHKSSRLRAKSNRPPKIVFPEDRLRREFYKNHPFETYRPRILMEMTGKNERKWSQLSDEAGEVTGEDVVRFQYYLMRTEGLSKQGAYERATQEFYKIRAREEMEAKIAQQEAMYHGAHGPSKPFSTRQLFKEESSIRQSGRTVKQRQEALRLKNSMMA
ncbi:mitochondrial ribosomal small subunit component [Coemansia sp. RSA 552]|nr:mitochondrial ribosomal small subunit component [Coemansia sp. RSA 552]